VSVLWDKGRGEPDELIARFTAADDAELDNELLGADLVCTMAHVFGLREIGVLAADEADTLGQAIAALLLAWEEGDLVVGPQDEDGHTTIERELTERCGELGKKVHTGRSRNDQVLAAQRLWLRNALQEASAAACTAAAVCFDRAAEHESTLLPGTTHLQRAVPSTVGFWFAGHGESLLEDARALLDAAKLVDTSPLGTAAGYGVNLPLARDVVREQCGFEGLIINGQCAQNGRGKHEAHALHALLMALSTVRRLSWDLSLWSTPEFGFVRMPDRFTTGSSIMPNKRNPDVVELLRAAFAEVAGAHAQLWQVLSLPSGYQRDLQVTKAPVLRGFGRGLFALAITAQLLEELTFDEARCAAAVDKGMLATDRAIELAKEGVPFRDAYRQAADELDELGGDDELAERARASVTARVSLGAPGDLQLDRLRARHASLVEELATAQGEVD